MLQTGTKGIQEQTWQVGKSDSLGKCKRLKFSYANLLSLRIQWKPV